jgi:2-polyprenyl-6-methoxyphenol hydroxylase-like FAD-dependent oxidoreductase
MKVIVVGGGISGLTMALSLHQAGIAVCILEAANELKALGVGINLQPTAVRELAELGLGETLARSGIATKELRLFNKFGQLVWNELRGLAAGYRWPQYSIHRGQLQMLLLAAVRERLGEDTFRSGCRLLSFEQRGNRVIATFRNDRTGAIETEEGDVLVGADGIHSIVRRQLYPTEGSPRFAQQILWRAAVEAEPILDGRTMIVAGHFHKRIVLYPIHQFTTPNRVLTNWICQMTVEDQAPPKEDWNKRISQDKVLAAIGSFRGLTYLP